MQLPEYMTTTFPGLSLSPDLFHRWTVGLRFELNTTSWPAINWESVLDRASTLYEAVFRPGDVGFIVSSHDFEFEPKGRSIGKMPKFRNSVFALSRKHSLCLHGVAGRRRFTSYRDQTSQIIATLRWTEISPRNIGYKEILRAVMHRDFPSRRPRTDDYVYFVNRTRNIILHMYDDRGLDLVALRIDDLRPVYDKHEAWILDHDRKQIDEIFSCSVPGVSSVR